MAGPVALRAAISGVVAGCTAVGVTLLVEQFGGIVGGVLGTVPTSIVPSSVGIRLQKDDAGFQHAMFAVPVGMVINSGFLFLWRVIPPRFPKAWSWITKLVLMVVISLTYWLLAAVSAYWILWGLSQHGINLLWAGITALSLNAIGGFLLVTLWPLPAPKGTKPVGWIILLCRGALACIAVVVAVALAATNDVVAGIASTFPAIFLTTMLSLCISQGDAVALGATGPMILGSLSVGAFALSFAYGEPYFEAKTGSVAAGIAVACILMWIGAVLFVSVPVFFYLRWRRSKSPPDTAQQQLTEVKAANEAGAGSTGTGDGQEPSKAGFPALNARQPSRLI